MEFAKRIDIEPRALPDLIVFNTTGLPGANVELRLHEIFMPIVGMLIILVNIIVLVSSGLILHRGQQPRTTYLFLGNISLADMIIGFSLIFGQLYPRKFRNDMVCAIEIGMLVSANLTSVYSIGLISIDRFLYILAGMRYQAYIYPNRARLMILTAWTIGILVGFIPAMGYRGDTNDGKLCWFILIEPPPLILMTTTVGSMPLLLTVMLYSIILYHALKKTAQLKRASRNSNGTNSGNLRIFRGGVNSGTPSERASHEGVPIAGDESRIPEESTKCCCFKRKSQIIKITPIYNPSKWKAIKIVLFTTGAFCITWLPYFIASGMYALSTAPRTSKFKRELQIAIASPLAILGVMNSLLNPIVYAWWHPGFRNSFKKLWNRCRDRPNSPGHSNHSQSHTRSRIHTHYHMEGSNAENEGGTPILNSRQPSRTHSVRSHLGPGGEVIKNNLPVVQETSVQN